MSLKAFVEAKYFQHFITTLIVTFIMINLFIGIIVDAIFTLK